jgi:hypothetical protein
MGSAGEGPSGGPGSRQISTIDKKSLCPYGSTMDQDALTVSDLVERANPRSEAEHALWLRRLRYWSTQGILKPIGHQHEGTGRHRRYPSDEAYLAAVLLRLAMIGPIGAISHIANRMREGLAKSGPFSEAWAAAKMGADSHIGFGISEEFTEHPIFGTGWGVPASQLPPPPQPTGWVRMQMPRGAVAETMFPGAPGEGTAGFLVMYVFGTQIHMDPLGTAPVVAVNLGAIFRRMKG